MEKEIVRLNSKNFGVILDEFRNVYTTSKQSLLDSTIDCILFMPHNHYLISKFILQACHGNRTFHHDFVTRIDTLDITDALQFFSLLKVLSYLERNSLLEKNTVGDLVKILSLDLFTDLIIFLDCSTAFDSMDEAQDKRVPEEVQDRSEDNPTSFLALDGSQKTIDTELLVEDSGPGSIIRVKVSNELKENVRNKITEFNSLKLKYKDMQYECFIAQQMIQNLSFNISECTYQLATYFTEQNIIQLVYGVLIAARNVDIVIFILLVLSFAKEKGFLRELYPFIDPTDESMRTLCCFVFEQYYNNVGTQKSYYDANSTYNPSFSAEEMESFKRIVDKDVIEEMRLYSSKEDLEAFFGVEIGDNELEITEEAFRLQDALNEHKEVGMSQKDFFQNFCLIGSPSITHFLVNLEQNSSYFRLDRDSQKLFCGIFLDLFKDKRVFKGVICKKLLKFGVIGVDVAREVPELFGNI